MSNICKVLFGGKRVKAFLKGKCVALTGIGYTPTEGALSAPTISLDGDILTMIATDSRTDAFAIFVDGVEMATVEMATVAI